MQESLMEEDDLAGLSVQGASIDYDPTDPNYKHNASITQGNSLNDLSFYFDGRDKMIQI